jgi:sulfonate transport system permease protein
MNASAGRIVLAPPAQRTSPAPAALRHRHSRWIGLLALAVPAALLAVWATAGAFNALPPLLLPPPAAVLQALRDLAVSGDLASALIISLRRMLLGFALGAGCGLALGALLGLSHIAERILRPTLMAFVQIPVLAWIPLLMIPFGIGETLKFVCIGIAAFTPVVLNSSKGFRQVPRGLIEVGTLYHLTPSQRLRHILLPGALPAIFTGLRLGLTQAWQSLVVVELVASTEGIGYLAVMARQMFQLDQMLAVMLVIGVCGFALDKTMRGIESACARRFGTAAA